MKRINVLAATLALLAGASGAAFGQPRQHDQRRVESRTASVAVVAKQGGRDDGFRRGSTVEYAQPRSDREDWNNSFVYNTSGQHEIRGRDLDRDVAGDRTVDRRQSEDWIQQTRQVEARNMRPVRHGTPARDRF